MGHMRGKASLAFERPPVIISSGSVAGTKEGRANAYTPLVKEADYLSSESRSFLERLHGGSLSSLVVSLYPAAKLTEEDVAALERILEKGEK